MNALVLKLHQDEAGFIVSAELVLIATILVIGMIVGLSEISNGVNAELEDVGSAVGSMNQSYRYSGFTGHKGWVAGSSFLDTADFCDGEHDISCDSPARPEAGRKVYDHGY